MVSEKSLRRDVQQAEINAAIAQGQVQAYQEALGIQGQNVEFLQGSVIEGQTQQAQLTGAIQRNVLKSLSNFQLQQKQMIQEISDKSKQNKFLMVGALALGAIALIK